MSGDTEGLREGVHDVTHNHKLANIHTVETHLRTHSHTYANNNHICTQRQSKRDAKDNSWWPYPETVILQLMFFLGALRNLIPSSCRGPCSSQPVRPPATVFRPADSLQGKVHRHVNHIPLTQTHTPKPWQTGKAHNTQAECRINENTPVRWN